MESKEWLIVKDSNISEDLLYKSCKKYVKILPKQ